MNKQHTERQSLLSREQKASKNKKIDTRNY
jgi:hypothetical protein